ncbi:GMC oxidoreductase [Zopfia rhizophila CBS 207.26]|uniref:GMC oxidoreductase n=1 Tax=Zopfia rhizophila CBS 207.26 TaxID=1314779 RepID=A0A6A6E0R5_9PEZI|nr:GMC oxidoreductase [Zopfia rhizophila CBS 207.26]
MRCTKTGSSGTHTNSTNSLIIRVLFSNSSTSGRPRAVGVEYLHGQALYRADRRNNGVQTGQFNNATATREFIAAGGAFNTPLVLNLSGISPQEELERFDIPVVIDLPAVDENLQDNCEGGVTVQASIDFESTFEGCTFIAPGYPCLRQWREDHSGPYGQGAASVSMLRRSSVSENEYANLFYFGAGGAVFRGHFPGFSTAQFPPSSFFWSIVKMQSQNRAGIVKLRSADPQDVPEINFNFFAEGRDHDLQALAEGVEFALSIFNSTGASYGPFRQIKPRHDISIRQGILDEAFSHHASSSYPIGRANGSTACVDSRSRAQGVDNLRVVDAPVSHEYQEHSQSCRRISSVRRQLM